MSEFTAADPEVRTIAAVFGLRRWKWAVRDGQTVEPYIPDAGDIARALDRLYDYSTMAHGEGNSGSSSSGRLFLSWIDEGYGHEVTFGIEWNRLPMLGFGA